MFSVTYLINVIASALQIRNVHGVDVNRPIVRRNRRPVEVQSFASSFLFLKGLVLIFFIVALQRHLRHGLLFRARRIGHPRNALGIFRILHRIQLNVRRCSIFICTGIENLSRFDERRFSLCILCVNRNFLRIAESRCGQRSTDIGFPDFLAVRHVDTDPFYRLPVFVGNDNLRIFSGHRILDTNVVCRFYFHALCLAGKRKFVGLALIVRVLEITGRHRISEFLILRQIGRHAHLDRRKISFPGNIRICLLLYKNLNAVIGLVVHRRLRLFESVCVFHRIIRNTLAQFDFRRCAVHTFAIICLQIQANLLTQVRSVFRSIHVYLRLILIGSVHIEGELFGRFVSFLVSNQHLNGMGSIRQIPVVQINRILTLILQQGIIFQCFIGNVLTINPDIFSVVVHAGCVLVFHIGNIHLKVCGVGLDGLVLIVQPDSVYRNAVNQRVIRVRRIRTVYELYVIDVNGALDVRFRNPNNLSVFLDEVSSRWRQIHQTNGLSANQLKRSLQRFAALWINQFCFHIFPAGPVNAAQFFCIFTTAAVRCKVQCLHSAGSVLHTDSKPEIRRSFRCIYVHADCRWISRDLLGLVGESNACTLGASSDTGEIVVQLEGVVTLSNRFSTGDSYDFCGLLSASGIFGTGCWIHIVRIMPV